MVIIWDVLCAGFKMHSHSRYDVNRAPRAYGARNPRASCSHYDVILIVMSFITELTTPSVTDERMLRTYGHLTAFNIGLHCVPEKRPPFLFFE